MLPSPVTMPPTWKPGEAEDAIVLELHRLWQEHDHQPAFRDLAATFKVSIGTIQYHVQALRDAGLIHDRPHLWLTTAGHARARRLSRNS